MFAKFSTTSSALQLLQVGECGRVTRLAPNCDSRTTASLHAAGIQPGALVTVEQRFPRFLVRVGSQRVALRDREVRAVSVRLAADCSLAV